MMLEKSGFLIEMNGKFSVTLNSLCNNCEQNAFSGNQSISGKDYAVRIPYESHFI